MDAAKAIKLLTRLGFSGTGRLARSDVLKLIWQVRDDANMRQITAPLEQKGRRLPESAVRSQLPMLSAYRDFFASIDKLDAFLAEAESSAIFSG